MENHENAYKGKTSGSSIRALEITKNFIFTKVVCSSFTTSLHQRFHRQFRQRFHLSSSACFIHCGQGQLFAVFQLGIKMDKVVEAVENVKREWNEEYGKILDHIKAIEGYGKSSEGNNSLPRLNGLAQDGLSLLQSLQFKLDLLAPQLPTDDGVQYAQALLESWKTECQSLRLKLRNSNLQAKDNMRKAAQKEREQLLGGGEESTRRRRDLQTKAGMTAAAESITESLRRTRQLMVQEVERSGNTLVTFEESTGVLRKAETEYKGHRSLLMRTRNLLSTMQRQDVIDRVVLAIGFFLFSCAVLYVVSKRIGILKLQRKVTTAIKAGIARRAEIGRGAGEDGIGLAPLYDNAVPNIGIPIEGPMHDEL